MTKPLLPGQTPSLLGTVLLFPSSSLKMAKKVIVTITVTVTVMVMAVAIARVLIMVLVIIITFL